MSSSTATLDQRAAVVDGDQSAGDQIQLVTFQVGDEEFAVDILAVHEINRMMTITQVPQAPDEVDGVINLRGRIIPVVDLRKRFSLPTVQRNAATRIIVVEVADRILGFVVDRVHEVLRIDGKVVDPAPTDVTTIDSDYLGGIAKMEDRLILLLELERLFAAGQLEELQQVTHRAAA